MKVLHTITGFGSSRGGTSTCTYDLLSAINRLVPGVDLLSPDVADPTDKLMGHGEPWIKLFPNDCRTSYSYSPNNRKAIEQSHYDLYHTNGLWSHVNHVTCAFARKVGKPYVITTHGMLYPEAVKRSRWKKIPFELLFFRKDILEASCIHVTCETELRHVRNYGYKGPVAIIGNPVAIPPYIEEITAKSVHIHSRATLGFLGRLHPIKQAERLLYGVALLPDPSAVDVVIMGKGDDAYEDFLRKEVQRLGLENVSFKGFVSGRDKFESLASMSALFVPSDMENFGMIIPEALLVKTPVMASLGTPWEQLNDNRCGWWVDNSPESIRDVILKILSSSPEELLEMGERGAKLVKEKYSDYEIARQMISLYAWLLGNRPKPEFVDTL